MHLHRTFASCALVILVTSLVGCSKQGEGDRCLRSNGNSDCEGGLVCIASDKLQESVTNPQFAADRCCPKEDTSSEALCARRTAEETAEETGTAGSPGSAGSEAQAGASAGGDAGANQAGSSGGGG